MPHRYASLSAVNNLALYMKFLQESNAAKLGGSEYPERVGQPVCEFFLKTGKCRFGPLCKYHHPKHGVGSVLLNNSGYPLRQGERECSYYVKTGQCKFGSACKFDHPQPISPSIQSPPPATYPMVQPPFVPPSQPYPSLPSWQVGNPSISPTSCMPGFYGPILVSPSIVPVPGWSPYEQPGSPVVYPCGQQMVQAGLSYPVHYQSSPTSAYPGPYIPISSSTRPSSVHQKVPEGQGKTVCQYYMKTGICKFGNMCKYHHPPTMRSSYANGNTSPVSIHLHQVSNAYPSASSIPDVPMVPYPIGFSLETFVPPPTLQSQYDIPREDSVIIQELT